MSISVSISICISIKYYSIATRIPPSQILMIGWFVDCRTGGLTGLEELEGLGESEELRGLEG